MTRILTVFFFILALAWGCFGQVYMSQMNPDVPLDAQILELVRRIETNPDNPGLHNDLGVKLQARRFPKDAMREFKKAIEADKTFYPAWYNLGVYYLENGQRFKALRALKKTLKLKKGHDLAEYHLGDLYYAWGMTKRAVRHYAKAFKINQHVFDLSYNPSALNNEVLSLVAEYYYRKYRGSNVVPYQETPDSLRLKMEEIEKAKEAERQAALEAQSKAEAEAQKKAEEAKPAQPEDAPKPEEARKASPEETQQAPPQPPQKPERPSRRPMQQP